MRGGLFGLWDPTWCHRQWSGRIARAQTEGVLLACASESVAIGCVHACDARVAAFPGRVTRRAVQQQRRQWQDPGIELSTVIRACGQVHIHAFDQIAFGPKSQRPLSQ